MATQQRAIAVLEPRMDSLLTGASDHEVLEAASLVLPAGAIRGMFEHHEEYSELKMVSKPEQVLSIVGAIIRNDFQQKQRLIDQVSSRALLALQEVLYTGITTMKEYQYRPPSPEAYTMLGSVLGSMFGESTNTVTKQDFIRNYRGNWSPSNTA